MEAPRRRAGLIAVAAALLAAAGCGSEESCRSSVRDGVPPEWARGGFGEAEPRAPHAVGDEERIAGIVFGHPLTAPPQDGRQNKILWVTRDPTEASELSITARRGDETETRTVDLGPSVVDLPEGCWELTVEWDGGSDTLALEYD